MTAEDTKQAGSGVGLPPGSKIGKYEVVQRLGIGGQAIVYKCRDVLLDRPVAVKQISSHLAEDPKFLQRFRTEAQILAKLGATQSGIVTIYELVEDERGLFIVMELVPGRTLEQLLESNGNPMQPKVVLQILWRLAATLRAVHKADIIHRDIKPSNIIISDGLRPKISDFGVAASLSGQTSMMLGTTKYMAPELFAGGEVTGRADMYALGFVMYEMLIGRKRFNELFEDIVRDRHTEALRWMKWHGNEGVRAPSAHELNPAVPEALSQIVDKMISKRAEERFENMEALGRAMKLGLPSMPRPGGRSGTFAGLGAGDGSSGDLDAEGAEQEPVLEDAPTAAIPKQRLPLKTKLILLGAVVFLAVAAGVFHLVRSSIIEGQKGAVAKKIYEDALNKYEARHHPAALEGFSELATNCPRELEWRWRASVFVPLCEGYVAVENRQWEVAATKEAAAREQLTAVQRQFPALVEWTRGAIDKEMESFNKHRLGTRAFVEAMAEGEGLLAKGEYDNARNTVTHAVRNMGAPTPAQTQEYNQFMLRADTTEFRDTFKGHVSEADQLFKQRKLPEATAACDAALKYLREALAERVVSMEERAQLQARVAEMKSNILTAEGYEKKIAEANAAEAAKDLVKALRALEEAQAIRPSDELKDRIEQLRDKVDLDQAQLHIEAARIPQAIAKLDEILKRNPGNQAARGLREKLTKQAEVMTLKSQADSLFALGKYAEAQLKYQEALSKTTDAEMMKTMREKMKECQYMTLRAQVSDLIAERKWDQAQRILGQMVQLMPSKYPEIKVTLEQVAAMKAYCELIDQAKRALEIKDWDKAEESAKNASKSPVAVRTEWETITNDARYGKHMAMGDDAADRREYATALGYYNIAKRYKNTPEVTQKIDLMKQLMAASEE